MEEKAAIPGTSSAAARLPVSFAVISIILLGALSPARADNVDGSGKQTGFFVYDIWNPQAGLDAGT